mgnify:CR=1 FL=1
MSPASTTRHVALWRGINVGTAKRIAMADLRTVLEDKGASNEAIKAKLEALRTARVKAKEELAASQKDLREVLNTRQEAVLVANGVLE